MEIADTSLQTSQVTPSLKVIPLGGVHEIGMNMTLFQYADEIIVVDAGIMFPEEDMHGIDYVIPDFSYLVENKHLIKAIILTHGHEDHTGAIPFLLKEIDAPVYGTALTIAMVKQKLIEHSLNKVSLIAVKPRDIINVGHFEIEFIRVTHSIVDGVALAISTPVGIVIHTGDFKLDPTPVDNELMDFYRFLHYAQKGVLLMLSDSTNAEKGGYTFSEKEVRRAFEDIFAKSSGRIIIATFASNIHRLQQAIDVATQFGRCVFLCGKSLVANASIALNLGYLKIPPNTWLKLDRLKDYPDDKVVIITTGSQGEPMSVLSRIAVGEHKEIKIKPTDTVILSAKVIPGNERSIGRIINHLMRRGADVIYEKVSEIHVSGHASKEELKLMINLIRPKYFVPIHGEFRHLKYHSKLAEKSGIPTENIFLLENGSVLELTGNSAKLADKVTAGRVYIDGKNSAGVQDMVLRDRKRLATDGFVLVLLGISKAQSKITFGPEIITRGFVLEDASKELLESIRVLTIETLQSIDADFLSDTALVQDKIRVTLKRYLRNMLDRWPMILPIIVES